MLVIAQSLVCAHILFMGHLGMPCPCNITPSVQFRAEERARERDRKRRGRGVRTEERVLGSGHVGLILYIVMYCTGTLQYTYIYARFKTYV